MNTIVIVIESVSGTVSAQCESQLQRQQNNNNRAAVELIERVLAGLFNFPSFQFPLPSQVAMHVKQTERSVDHFGPPEAKHRSRRSAQL